MSNGKGSDNGKVSGHDDTVFAPAKAQPRQTQVRLGGPQQKVQLRREELAGHHSTGSPMGEGTVGGRYRLIRPLGSGAMGAVYEAKHIDLDDRVAIKMLVLPQSAGNDTKGKEMEKRFRQEARIAASIKHDNIVRVTDFGKTQDGRFYFVMDYCERCLSSAIREEGGIPLGRARDIMAQVCRGLGEAHRMGIIHRDMKPENVMLTEYMGNQDFVKLIDFGIAKIKDAQKQIYGNLTVEGMVVGTPQYMSPEQAMGKGFDHRTDVYAAGLIFYEMLCGKPPFVSNADEDHIVVLNKHIHESPAPPSQARPDLRLPPEVDQVILKALEKDPQKRFGSMAEFAEAVMSIPDASKETVEPGVTLPPFPAAEESHFEDDATTRASVKIPIYRKKPVIGAAIATAAVGVAAGALLLFGSTKHAGVSQGSDARAAMVSRAGVPDSGPATRPVADSQATAADKTVRKFRIRIATEPEGADVMRDGESRGTTPLEFDLPQSRDKVRFVLRKRGYRDEALEITPDDNQRIERKLTHERARNGVKKKKKDDRNELPVPDYLKRGK